MDDLNVIGMAAESGKHHEAKDTETEPKTCLNCGQEVPRLYCGWCGQSSKEVRVSIKTLFMDFLGDYFTFDSKLFRSIVPLFFKPGFLTDAFMSGKRMRYIPPLRLYIFTSILFFLTLAMVTREEEPVFVETSPPAQSETVEIENPQNTQPVEGGDQTESAPKKRKGNVTISDERFDEDSAIGRYLNRKIDAQERKIEAMGHDAFMKALVREFLAFLPKALFILMPFFALLLKLCYLRRDPLFIDHLIFAFHFHAFIYVFTSIMLVIGSINDVLLALAITLGALVYPIYLLIAIKKVYAQNWLWSIMKFLVISGIYFTGLSIFVLFVFIFSIFLV